MQDRYYCNVCSNDCEIKINNSIYLPERCPIYISTFEADWIKIEWEKKENVPTKDITMHRFSVH